MDDISLREDILDELSFEPSLDAVNIGVTVERGVRGVTNLISVRAPLDVGDIRSHIEGALKRSAEVEAHAIRVGVEGGKVTLEGRVNTWHERNVVERAAWAVPGVSAVEDRLSIG